MVVGAAVEGMVGGTVGATVEVVVDVDVEVEVDVDEVDAIIVSVLDVLAEHPATAMASKTPPASRITTVAASSAAPFLA